MPIYPAMALLIGSALASESLRIRMGERALQIIFATLFVALGTLLLMVWRLPATGDIAQALVQHPQLYTLSLGHFGDLTLTAFAYLKLPLALAAAAFALGAVGMSLFHENRRRVAALAVAMIIFFQAARLALVRFDGYLGSYPLAQ